MKPKMLFRKGQQQNRLIKGMQSYFKVKIYISEIYSINKPREKNQMTTPIKEKHSIKLNIHS
jgi:hypothetical protein